MAIIADNILESDNILRKYGHADRVCLRKTVCNLLGKVMVCVYAV